MKRWGLLVAFLYFLILVALTWPVLIAAFSNGVRDRVAPAAMVEVFLFWPYWLWVATMVLSQVALLTVPVRAASRRPVSHRSLLLPILASGLMMGGLVIGVICSLYEFNARGWNDAWVGWSILFAGGLTWCVWTIVFYRLSRKANPVDIISRQCRYLLKGSILELLVAVPTHIVARSRDYCCAGVMTFVGLTMGISVMLFSFGPAVFFLFVDRWKRLHPNRELRSKSAHLRRRYK